MRKIFTFVLGTLLLGNLASLSAAETTVWTGSEPVSWNSEVYVGTQFETPAGTFTGLAAGNTIKAVFKADIDEPQYVMTYKAGDAWDWTDLEVTLADSTMTYTVASEQIATEIAERGLIFRGQGYILTRIAVITDIDDPEPQPEPQEYEDQTVWTGDSAISWNPEAYPGTELDTYNVQQDMLAGIAKDDSIKIYYTDAVEGAQFALTYKAGESWAWTDLTVTNHGSFFACKVASDEIAMDIADHGLVIRGQGYHLTAIVIGKPQTTHSGVENTVSATFGGSTKILRNGQILILRDGKTFNAFGQLIDSL